MLIEDDRFGTTRTEVRCAEWIRTRLGHVFTGEGCDIPTSERWCINSVSLNLEPASSSAAGLQLVQSDCLSSGTAQTSGMIRTRAVSGERSRGTGVVDGPDGGAARDDLR